MALAILGVCVALVGVLRSTSAGPAAIPLDQFLANPPTSGWYRITGTYILPSQFQALNAQGAPQPGPYPSVYVAVHGLKEKPDDIIHIIAKVNDPALINQLASFQDRLSKKGSNRAAIYAEIARSTSRRDGDVVGTIDPLSNDVIRRFFARSQNVDPNFTVINEGEQPAATGLPVWTIVGVVMILASIVWWFAAKPKGRVQALQAYVPDSSGPTIPLAAPNAQTYQPEPAPWEGAGSTPSGRLGSAGSGQISGRLGQSGPSSGRLGATGPSSGRLGPTGPTSGRVGANPARPQSSPVGSGQQNWPPPGFGGTPGPQPFIGAQPPYGSPGNRPGAAPQPPPAPPAQPEESNADAQNSPPPAFDPFKDI